MNLDKTNVAAAFVSTSLISLAPNLLLFLFPSVANGNSSFYLSLGQALAAGGLLGDVFLHTLPHAYADAEGDDAECIGQMILLGFLSFYLLDMVIRMASDGEGCGHGHGHSHKESHGHDNKTESTTTGAVILNLMADSLHNFTDGLAIGATYAVSSSSSHGEFGPAAVLAAMSASRGGLATMSVLFHEIPHELGDYAILVRHGFTKHQAIRLQFVTAIAALCGTGVGLLAGHFHGADQYMVPFTSGGFVYLAAVTILPELLAETPSEPKSHGKQKNGIPTARMLQALFFCIGIAFMQGVSMLEHMEGGSCAHGHDHRHVHDDRFQPAHAHQHHHHHHHHTNHSEL